MRPPVFGYLKKNKHFLHHGPFKPRSFHNRISKLMYGKHLDCVTSLHLNYWLNADHRYPSTRIHSDGIFPHMWLPHMLSSRQHFVSRSGSSQTRKTTTHTYVGKKGKTPHFDCSSSGGLEADDWFCHSVNGSDGLFKPVVCRLLRLSAFRALLQIRAMRKKLSPLSPTSFNPVITSQTSDSEEHSVRRSERLTQIK